MDGRIRFKLKHPAPPASQPVPLTPQPVPPTPQPVPRPHRNPKVISFSRRTDAIANRPMLEGFLKILAAPPAPDGTKLYEYPHPWFGPSKPCHFDLSQVDVISWWSKDFANLIELWPLYEQVLSHSGLKHHFSFAINGPERSILEPGLQVTLEQRYHQLVWLVNKCRQLGQNPDRSIMVKVDPISVYRVATESGTFGPWLNTAGHVPELCRVMKSLNLTRLHMSFTQIQSFKNTTGKRLKKMASHLEIRELTTAEEQYEVYQQFLEPYVDANGIRVDTCTATELIKATANKPNPVVMDACVGWRDIAEITGLQVDPLVGHGKGEAVRNCTCYPNRDIGSKSEPCTHGCRYCMAKPKMIDW